LHEYHDLFVSIIANGHIYRSPGGSRPSPLKVDWGEAQEGVGFEAVFVVLFRIKERHPKKGGPMTNKTLEKMIDDQVRKWELERAQERAKRNALPVITICREPGSGGALVAKGIADRLGLHLFDREIIDQMVLSTQVSTRLIETLDERALSVMQDWISTLIFEKHLWPDQYLRHLMKVIGTIGKHGRAVIVGRGANFILPPNDKLRIRIVAPFETRVFNVARDFGVPVSEARRRVLKTESDRRAFIHNYFHADVADPHNYDLVFNTARLSIEETVDAVVDALC
jgi:cytidylate kinase